ncbi:MAG: transcriptional regulator, NifA subfamily, Fis Family, partial [Anaeromyxobacteraceae bacterium]|nr:transcriptional regulator, NifA subfamily, Fis Family [Anaeromyxobacteraceae bacterium]
LADGPLVTAEDLDLRQDALDATLPLADAIEEFRKRYISEILERNGGNRTKTAKDLDVDPRTVFRHLEKLESERRGGSAPATGPTGGEP